MYISSNDIKMKRQEAKLLGFDIIYSRKGELVTEVTSTDISSLEKYFTKEEYNILETVLRTARTELDKIHNRIEADLNARKA